MVDDNRPPTGPEPHHSAKNGMRPLLHRSAGSIAKGRPWPGITRKSSFGPSSFRRSRLWIALFDGREHTAHRAHFQMVPARLGQHVAQGQAGGLGARRREEVIARHQHGFELADHAFQFFLRGRGKQVFDRRLGERFLFRPFIGAQDHRLSEIERGEFGIDRHGHDRAGQRHVLGLKARAFRPEDQRRTPGIAVDRAGGFLGRHDRLGHAALAHGGGIDMGAIGNRFGQAFEHRRAFKHFVGPGRGRPGGVFEGFENNESFSLIWDAVYRQKLELQMSLQELPSAALKSEHTENSSKLFNQSSGSDSEKEKEQLMYEMIRTVELKKDKTAEEMQREIYYLRLVHEDEKLVKISKELIEKFPEKKDYLLELSKEFFEQQKIEKSLEIMTLYVDRFPEDLSAKSNKGMLLEMQGSKKEALKIYEEILAKDPNQTHTKELYNKLKQSI